MAVKKVTKIKKTGSTAKKNAVGVWIHGSTGKMGREIQQCLVDHPDLFRFEGGSGRRFEGAKSGGQGQEVTEKNLGPALEKATLIIDFSTVEGHKVLLKALESGKINDKFLLVGTTGLASEIYKAWEKLAKQNQFRILFAPNTSLGILALLKMATSIAKFCSEEGFDIELVETHHRHKKDAPSGTAKFLSEAMAKAAGKRVVTERKGLRERDEIGVHAVRGGGVFGEHQIRLISDHEEISLTHRAFSRGLFARGVLRLGDWLLGQKAGVYSLNDIQF